MQLEIENTQEHILTGKNQNVEIQAPKMAETDQAEKTLDSIIDQNFEVQSDGFEKMQLQLTNQNLVVEIQEPKMAVLDDIKKKQIKTVETGKATVHTSLKPKTKTFSGAWGDIFRELGQEDKPVHENTRSSMRRVKVEKYPELGYMYEAAGF